MAMSTGGRGAVSDINVTPLVDVMLVLLIIFMVTAPLISQGVPVQLPKTKAEPLAGDDDKKLVLTVTLDKKIFIGANDQNPIPFADLETKLKANAKIQQDKQLFIHADKKLEYGFVVEIMAIAKRAGVENLGMVTDPLTGEAGH
jgi:biopolymer transport protein TolR